MPRTTRFARVLGAGVSAGVFWCAVATLSLDWLALTLILVGPNGVAGLAAPTGGMALVAIGGLLLARRMPPALRVWKALLGLAVMSIGFLVFLLTVHIPVSLPHTTAQATVSFVKVAIIAFCVHGGRRSGPAVTAIGAYLVNQVICVVIGGALGYPYGWDAPEAATLLILLTGSAGFALARRTSRRAHQVVVQVEREEALRLTRGVVRSQAAAVVHDTVLNDLAVLATSEPGALPPRVVDRLRSTLALLASPDWLEAPAEAAGGAGGGAVRAAVDRAAAEGLEVTLTGEVEALDRISPAVEQALGRAVEQCLVNTIRHAHVEAAEITVLADESEVSLMVLDAGDGFDLDAIEEDRMGIHGSVRSRVEAAGGRIRIFARPGFGTSILLTVPQHEAGVPA